MLSSRVVEYPLNKVVAVLITGNINQGNASAVLSTLTHTIEVTTQEIRAADFETLLHDLGCKLVSAILCCVTNYMIYSTTAIRRSPVLANMLNAPVAKLSVGYDVDIRKNFFDAWALVHVSQSLNRHILIHGEHTLSSSRQFSKMF